MEKRGTDFPYTWKKRVFKLNNNNPDIPIIEYSIPIPGGKVKGSISLQRVRISTFDEQHYPQYVSNERKYGIHIVTSDNTNYYMRVEEKGVRDEWFKSLNAFIKITKRMKGLMRILMRMFKRYQLRRWREAVEGRLG